MQDYPANVKLMIRVFSAYFGCNAACPRDSSQGLRRDGWSFGFLLALFTHRLVAGFATFTSTLDFVVYALLQRDRYATLN
jgi:hypothetical protein